MVRWDGRMDRLTDGRAHYNIPSNLNRGNKGIKRRQWKSKCNCTTSYLRNTCCKFHWNQSGTKLHPKTDRQTIQFQYILPNFVTAGIKTMPVYLLLYTIPDQTNNGCQSISVTSGHTNPDYASLCVTVGLDIRSTEDPTSRHAHCCLCVYLQMYKHIPQSTYQRFTHHYCHYLFLFHFYFFDSFYIKICLIF